MGNITILSILGAALFTTFGTQAQDRKIDTTASFGSAGFRVRCNNKNESENDVAIFPKGFAREVTDISFSIKGRLKKILVDDLNDDGYPDLVLCFYSGSNGEIGNIISVSSNGKSSLAPVSFPDIYSDRKLSEGYKGYDEFTILVGTLLQSFPVYKPGDTDAPTGGTKVVQYKIAKAENGFAFKVLRSYIKQQ